MINKNRPIQLILIYLIILIFVVISVYPILRVLTISLRPGDNLLNEFLRIIPKDATFENYVKLFTEQPFLIWIRNSLLVTLVVTIIGVSLASTAGYAFSRYKFPGRKIGLLGLLITQMFPATMLLLPLFIMLSKLHLINKFLGLIIMYSASALPFCVWLMKGYYDTIPFSLEESASMDGASKIFAFWKIVLPLASPALVISALFSFMAAWNEYIVAAQVLWYEDMFTIPLGLKSFQGNMTTEWGMYAAAALIISIPVIILFLVLSRWLVSGLTLGGVKG
ncbi:MAG: sugar ABC transporter permease [Bacteroidetes bacterium]|nr:sugar ABC transporter permease [Bacteroidota bacterium]